MSATTNDQTTTAEPIRIIFDIDAATGKIARVERIDPGGNHRDLSDEECALLAAGKPDDADDFLELTYLLSC